MGINRKEMSKKLLLNKYMCSLFGFNSIEDFRAILQNVEEGFDEDGHSHFFNVLINQKNIQKEIKDKLEDYDENIYEYMEKINRKREDKPISLKYFQYLAVLFTEIYLDKYFTDPKAFIRELNWYAYEKHKNAKENARHFIPGDLNKLSYWMATGSGKTIIMHINYLQFMKYNKGKYAYDYDNILLITPSEIMSKQHIDEMKKSNIPSGYFHELSGGYFTSGNRDFVKVLDIHKIGEEASGNGVTIPLEEFGKKNVVFVDEGHKGAGGDKWVYYRNTIAAEGFTFEYSATFAEAINAISDKEKRNKVFRSYCKSIIFDYSYKYFYEDGYGKDYRILNLKEKVYSESWDILMLANALTFYEQKRIYDEYPDKMEEYNIEPPLWIFVGSKVTGKKNNSDIIRIVKFIHRLLKDEEWAIQTIEKIMSGKTGLLDEQNRDVFSPEFPEKKLQYLHKLGMSSEEIYIDMLRRVFHISNSAPLHIVKLKGIEGEIGLRAGIRGSFFGVINIGDVDAFIKLAKSNEGEGYIVSDEKISSSLFDDIKNKNSKINVLIGAKKFMEGWDSWRVSSMGLMNIGKKEGSQIIQLFGRGVRLKGKDYSLKRSNALEGDHPDYIPILETLNIFGIAANYMQEFRKFLEEEGIDDEPRISLFLPIKINESFINEKLSVPHIDYQRFKKEEFFVITGDENVSVKLDLTPKVEIISSIEEGVAAVPSLNTVSINQSVIELLDWDAIYLDLLKYRTEHGWYNVVFSKESLKKIIKDGTYELYAPEEVVNPKSFSDLSITEEVARTILKKYLKKAYNRKRRIWGKNNVKMKAIEKTDDNLNFEYVIKIRESDSMTFWAVKNIIEKKIQELQEGDFSESGIENVYFDRHLYQPLLKDTELKIMPKGLNDDEAKFIHDLKKFLGGNPNFLGDKKLFVLRNRPKIGVGFYSDTMVFPDFILWIKSEDRQDIIFADPHGLGHAWNGTEDEKVKLAKNIKDIEASIQKEEKYRNMYLHSFVISINSYSEIRANFKGLSKERLIREYNIVFINEYPNYLKQIFSVIGL